MSLIFDLKQELVFHNVAYIIHAWVNEAGNSLTITAEQKDTGDRWINEFTAEDVEKMSHKTGNFKKFPVFVKMLSTAMLRNTQTVFIDLLTYSDLEMLKARKTGQQPKHTTSTNNKRYIILTYVVEFDRVHYPLPLKFEVHKDPESMRQTIDRLRQELQELRSDNNNSDNNNHNNNTSYKAEMTRLAEENKTLKNLLKQQGGRRSSASSEQDTIVALQEEVSVLTMKLQDHEKRMKRGGLVDGLTVAKKIKELERELFNAAGTLRKEKLINQKEVAKQKREILLLQRDNDKMKTINKQYRNKNDKLTKEITELKQQLRMEKLSKNNTTSSRPSSRSSSRPVSRNATRGKSPSQVRSRPSSPSIKRTSTTARTPIRGRTSSSSSLRARSNTPTYRNTKRMSGVRTPTSSSVRASNVYGSRPLSRSSSASKQRTSSATRTRPSSAGNSKKVLSNRSRNNSRGNTPTSKGRPITPSSSLHSKSKKENDDWSQRKEYPNHHSNDVDEIEKDSFDTSQNIADIDTRINKLQQFLKAAKSGMDVNMIQ